MATQDQINALLKRMKEMSRADISVLEASAKTPGSSMTTAPGSANELLWSEMVELGWMTKRDEKIELTVGTRFAMKIYRISPKGHQPILNLLAELSKATT